MQIRLRETTAPVRLMAGRGRLKNSGGSGLISLQVFGRHVVLRDLFCVNFGHVRVGCIFHAADGFRLIGLPLLDQFFNACGACLRPVRQSLGIPRLAG